MHRRCDADLAQMIRLADAALARNGRMVAAIEAIGRGVVAGEAAPFSLPADHAH